MGQCPRAGATRPSTSEEEAFTHEHDQTPANSFIETKNVPEGFNIFPG